MIRANREDSTAQDSFQDVLALLQDDFAWTEEADFSVSDLVVGRSVQSLPTTDARDLFVILGTCPEDASVPSAFVALLWESRQAGTNKSSIRLKSAAKKLTAMLVRANLLHHNAGVYVMHDIVR
jgi:hypothetical protein